MAKEEVIKDENGACPCKACKRKHIISYPIITNVTGLYYAKCSNGECDKYDPYQFIGTTKKNAIANWNDVMEHNDTELKKEVIDEL